jgi:uncharacterized membrane protein
MIVLVILAVLVIGMFLIDIHVIPHLSPDNKFRKWFKTYLIDDDPDHE